MVGELPRGTSACIWAVAFPFLFGRSGGERHLFFLCAGDLLTFAKMFAKMLFGLASSKERDYVCLGGSMLAPQTP